MANALQWAVGSPYLYTQDFEDGVIPSEWSEVGGSATWNYTPALRGNFSLGVTGTPLAVRAQFDYGTALPEVYGFFEMTTSNASGQLAVFDIVEPTAREVMIIGTTPNPTALSLVVNLSGASNAITVATFNPGDHIYVWFHFAAGCGASLANTFGEVWWSTTTTKPATGGNNYGAVSIGTINGNARTYNFYSGDTVADHFILSAGPLGDNP